MRRVLPVALLLLIAMAAPVTAQTRLTIAGGGLVPFGDLENSTDPSARAELRVEAQPVNAIGVVSSISFVGYVAWSDLALKSEVEEVLAPGSETEPYLLEVGGGARVYSRAAPFFVSGGAAWARYRPSGDADAAGGLDLHAGLGFLFPAGLFVLEPEVCGHVVLLDDADLQFVSATLGIALPF